MLRLIMLVATGCYAGYLPGVPGTWGSMVGLVLCLLLRGLRPAVFLAVVAGVLVLGCWAAGSAEKILNCNDPRPVVIDEIVGMLITLTAAPASYLIWGLGFVLFRFFDILKPFPINWIDRHLQGGIGIMLDDVMAGIYSFLVLQGVVRIFDF